MNEEELKKGCGKEAGFITFTDDFGNKDGDVMLCGDTTKKINGEIELFLCDTCQARLEGFQKGKLEERKMVLELIDNYICDDNECKECLNMRMLKLELQKEIKVSGDSLTEFWDNQEDDRWDKEYNPDLLPETLKNKEEKQDE